MNALELIASPPLDEDTFTKATVMLEANYGTEYSQDKMALLFSMMREDGWSKAQFQHTMNWFMKNKPFPAWTVADWFQHGVKVYPEGWCQQKVAEGWNWKRDIEAYRLPNGQIVYKPADGQELPFEKVNWTQGKKLSCPQCGLEYRAKEGHECYLTGTKIQPERD